MMLSVRPQSPFPCQNGVFSFGDNSSLPARGASLFFSVTGVAKRGVNAVLQHPFLRLHPVVDMSLGMTAASPSWLRRLVRTREFLPATQINLTNFSLLTLGLLSGCDGAMGLMIAESVVAAGLFASAGWLIKRNLIDVPRCVAQLRSDAEDILDFLNRIKSDAELALTAGEKPDVSVEILTRIQKAVIGRVADCSDAKIDMDALIRHVDKKIAEGFRLNVNRQSEAMQVLERIKHDAEERNENLRLAVTDLVMQSRSVVDWIALEEARADELQTLSSWLSDVAKLAGRAVTANRDADQTIADTEQLTAEIVHTQEVLERTASYIEVDAWKTLDSVRLLPQDQLQDLEEKLQKEREALQKEIVEARHAAP